MSSAAAPRSPRTGQRGLLGHPMRWAILAAVIVLVIVAVPSIWRDSAPARPAGLTGKLVYHGTKSVGDGATVTVVMGNRSFNPTYLRGSAGARVVVHLRAQGFRAHTFTVPSLGIDVTVAPGGVRDVPVTLPSGSTTIFFCRFHQSQGMQGAIIEPAGGSGSR